MSKQKGSKLLNLSKFLHRYYNLFFIILFIISLFSFAFIYFYHTNNVEKRFNNALKSYEQSLSNIFNNLSMETNNYTNESIVSNTSLSCTRDRISINNNNIMNMSEGDSFDELKKSFEIGLDLLKASLSEIMKNSNDVLTFWFAFLSVIMVVFTFAGYFINNNILEQSKAQLDIVKIKAVESIKEIRKESKIEMQKLIDENNKNIQISNLFNLGSNAINTKDYKLAEKYFSDIINLDNNNSTAYNNRGITKQFQGKYSEAILDYDKAIRLKPNDADFYNNRGFSKHSQSKYDEAILDYNKAIELNPNSSEAYNNRGACKQYMKDNEGAIEDYNKAIKLNPNYSEAYYNRGNAKKDLGILYKNIDYLEKAIKDFNKAIELNTYLSEAYFNRGISKSLLLEKIVNKNSEEYKKAFDDAYNDLDTAYNLANDKLKETIKNQVIDMAKKRNEVAKKFCEDKGWI